MKVNSVYGLLLAVQSGVGLAALPDYIAHNVSNIIKVLPEENGNYYDPMSAYNAFVAAGGGGGGGATVFYPGQGSYGQANYRPQMNYPSQADYDAAFAGGYLGYASQVAYDSDSAARGEGGGGGGGSFETVSEASDVVYAGGAAEAIGSPGSFYDLLGGGDTFGAVNNSSTFTGGTSMMDVVDGGSGNDKLYGGGGGDILKGGTGQDSIYGNAGQDVLIGGDGNDLLMAGEGVNVLIGGNIDDADIPALQGQTLAQMKAATTDDNSTDAFLFTKDDFGTALTGSVIPDFEDGTDTLGFHDGTSWDATPLASGKLTVTNNYSSTGETWVFSGTEVDGVAAGLVLFKIVDIVGGGAITDADFTTHGEVV